MDTWRCSRCKEALPRAAFSPSQFGVAGRWCNACYAEQRRNKRAGIAPARVTDICLNCGADIRDKRSHARWCSTSCAMKGWRAANPGRNKELYRRCVYGMEPEDFNALLESQGGICAICGIAPPRWHVDHDHTTGAVRGLLCQKCNQGLGQLGDSTVLLRAAIAYLER